MDHFLGKPQRIHIHILHLIISLQHAACYNATHIPGVTVASGNIVKIHEHIVEIAASGMDIDMVYIAHSAVKEQALGVFKDLLHCLTGKTGPVRGDLTSTHHVRMVGKMNQDNVLSIFLIKTKNTDTLVNIADGGQNIRIVHTGVSTDRAVLHAETADKCDIRCLTDAPAHSGRL